MTKVKEIRAVRGVHLKYSCRFTYMSASSQFPLRSSPPDTVPMSPLVPFPSVTPPRCPLQSLLSYCPSYVGSLMLRVVLTGIFDQSGIQVDGCTSQSAHDTHSHRAVPPCTHTIVARHAPQRRSECAQQHHVRGLCSV